LPPEAEPRGSPQALGAERTRRGSAFRWAGARSIFGLVHAAKTFMIGDPLLEIDDYPTQLLAFVSTAAEKAAAELGALEAEPPTAGK
jgi:hypothetical protein